MAHNVVRLDIQLKIVKILDDINNKLELNNKINNNLEEQLKILFEKEGKIHCGKFLSKKGFSQYIASIMEDLEDNGGIQDKMWKKLKKK